MSVRTRSLAVVGVLCVAAVFAAYDGVTVAAQNAQWGANYFPNVTLTTQHGDKVRFYDDLIKGKIVAVNLIYTTCKYACPLETARLAQVQRLLGARMGRDVFFYSITIDPQHDTPEVLKQYADTFDAGPGWLFLTGKQEDIDLISQKMGLYTPPDARNRDGHTPAILIGNEATGQWMRNSATDNPRFLSILIGDWLNSWKNQHKETPKSYADVSPLNIADKGQYIFATHCAACHTIGGGESIGPDLRGLTKIRDPQWLKKIIQVPETLLDEGDPLANALLKKYKDVRMPNLHFDATTTDLLISYMERQSAIANDAAESKQEQPKSPERN
jgi:protein SCO1/2